MRANPVVPLVIVGIAAAFFLLFVYGYPRLFPLIEASHPDHFEKNVADALAEGNPRRALKIARHATRQSPPNSMAYTVYARLLLESGETGQALEQLANVTAMQRGDQTRERHYFAPARLTLGKYYLEQGRFADAATNFELARGYAVPSAPEYKEFHAALYEVYAKLGLWARALEFGQPSDQELDGLDSREILRLAHVCEGEQNWTLITPLAERLLPHEALRAEAHYLLGRADLARQQYETSRAHLEHAASNHVPHATFFLGTALERSGRTALAIEALLSTPVGDLFRPFALAKASALLADLPEDEQALTTTTEQELLDQVDREIARMRLLDQPIPFDKYRRFTLAAVMPSDVYVAAGGRFPLLILWEDGQAPAAGPARMSFSQSDQDGALELLRGTGAILQLQWVENLVHWESVERLQPGAGALPGWIDTARDWFDLRLEYAAQIQKDDAQNSFLAILRPTWLYSIPTPVQDGVGYLLAARLQDPQGKARLGWQSLDGNDHVLLENTISDRQKSDSWTWQAGYMRSQLHWHALRVQLDTAARRPGPVRVDDIMLVQLDEPDPTPLN